MIRGLRFYVATTSPKWVFHNTFDLVAGSAQYVSFINPHSNS